MTSFLSPPRFSMEGTKAAGIILFSFLSAQQPSGVTCLPLSQCVAGPNPASECGRALGHRRPHCKGWPRLASSESAPLDKTAGLEGELCGRQPTWLGPLPSPHLPPPSRNAPPPARRSPPSKAEEAWDAPPPAPEPRLEYYGCLE